MLLLSTEKWAAPLLAAVPVRAIAKRWLGYFLIGTKIRSIGRGEICMMDGFMIGLIRPTNRRAILPKLAVRFLKIT